MKRHWYGFTIYLASLSMFIAGCTFAGKPPATLTVEPSVTASSTRTMSLSPSSTATATSIETLQPTSTLTPTPFQIVLPAVTMSPQESEAALLKLLKTNGNCTGKCVADIRPDDMTVQDAVNIMSEWGMVSIGENWQGKTFIHLEQPPLYGQINVRLSVGTWTQKLETIDRISFGVEVFSSDRLRFVQEDTWLANRDAWWGIRLDNILKAYGAPSFVGYFFATAEETGSTLEGRTITYDMAMQYEQLNMEVVIGALAYYDGETLFLCPSNDPHNLGMTINPERSLKILQEFSPVAWQALTDTDLEAFYQMFTDKTNPNACITTTLEQIQALQPDFH